MKFKVGDIVWVENFPNWPGKETLWVVCGLDHIDRSDGRPAIWVKYYSGFRREGYAGAYPAPISHIRLVYTKDLPKEIRSMEI